MTRPQAPRHRAIGPKFMHVYPNPYGVAPWCTLDKTGRAAGKVPRDAGEDGSSRAWVGVLLDRKRTRFLAGKPAKGDDLRSRPQESVFSYLGISSQELTPGALVKRDPVKLPITRYYVQQVQSGSLIPADDACAKVCAVKFQRPSDVLKLREKEAIKDFDGMYGAGAFEAQKAERDEAEKNRAAEEADEPKPSKAKKTSR